MKIINAHKLQQERVVKCPNGGFVSRRLLLKEDNMGYTLTRTTVSKGKPQYWHYKYHLESCYCLSGKGIITNLSNGECHEIKPDIAYVLDKYDPHTFEALEETVLLCIFNPPLTGKEVHQKDGSYISK